MNQHPTPAPATAVAPIQQILLTEDAFFAQFAPQTNHLVPNAPWYGCMFETYGPELQYVQGVYAEDPLRIWTLVECDGHTSITCGMQHVNRVGYLVTSIPARADTLYEVEEDEDDQERCSSCSTLLDDAGDGWDGLCGDCADVAENTREASS